MLEQEVREAVLSTAGTAAGAGAFGVLLTSILPTTVEDLLALSLAGMAGYVSILNLPMRRAEAKRKLESVTNTFSQASFIVATVALWQLAAWLCCAVCGVLIWFGRAACRLRSPAVPSPCHRHRADPAAATAPLLPLTPLPPLRRLCCC